MEEKASLLQKLTEEFGLALLDGGGGPTESVGRFEPGALPALAARLRQGPYDYVMLLDVTCVDYLAQESCLEMIYTFFSLSRLHRLRLKTRLAGDDPHIASLTPLWKNADWLEREVYDMFGVRFDGHPDLRRIFMYEGFEGYPLRKSYPLRRRQPRLPLRT